MKLLSTIKKKKFFCRKNLASTINIPEIIKATSRKRDKRAWKRNSESLIKVSRDNFTGPQDNSN
jgi:dTDP-D-glucose 4,6-dehydratase